MSLLFIQTTTDGRTTAAAEVGDDVLEGAAKLDVEHGVQDGVDRRVGVAEPEEESIQPVGKIREKGVVSDDSPSHVEREEAEPHGAEDANDCRHADRCTHLAAFTAVALTGRTRCLLSHRTRNVRRLRLRFRDTFVIRSGLRTSCIPPCLN